MSISKKDLGLLVKKARKIKEESTGKKYSQNALATEIGKTRGYIGDLETGRYYEYFLSPDLSAEHINYSLKMREKLGDEVEIAISLQQLAWTLGVFKGEIELSLRYLEQSLAIFKKYEIKYHIAPT